MRRGLTFAPPGGHGSSDRDSLDEIERAYWTRPHWRIWHPRSGYNETAANPDTSPIFAQLEAAGWMLLYWVPEEGEFHD